MFKEKNASKGFNPSSAGWAKTDEEGNPGLSVFNHCRHVGWVALEIIRQGKAIPDIRIKPIVAAVQAATHDVGKWSGGFLVKCPVWLAQELLADIAKREDWVSQGVARHEKHSQDAIQLLLLLRGFKQSEAAAWGMIAGAHHGKLHPSDNFCLGGESSLLSEWDRERHQIIGLLESEFGKIETVGLKKSDPVVAWLMGLTSVADWIGSDEAYFPVRHGLSTEKSQEAAELAVQSIGLSSPSVRDALTFESIFGFEPHAMQKAAMDMISSPGIYVIEAPMGLGKTEAALACAYQLMQKGLASGIYFALPTQLTSNRIHLRVSDFIARITEGDGGVRLVHANAWLDDSFYQPRPVKTVLSPSGSDAIECRDWFASAKRALLSSFGVGTIDQALMSVVAVKHFFVRRFALAGKVVIIDEVHSYDHFTGTLIRILCDELIKLGSTVIILSATLLPTVRNKLLNIPCRDSDDANDAYPLISGRRATGEILTPAPSLAVARPSVNRLFKTKGQLLEDAIEVARLGARVLWVCNTVNEAQSVYRSLKEQGALDVGILHSRFPHYLRQKHEEYWMRELGKGSKRHQGCILVSTQIVEQSVDVDADVLISELAPMDMLLQRIGRVWRHLSSRPAECRPCKAPEIWLVAENVSDDELEQSDASELKTLLGAKARVYAPYTLLKTHQVMRRTNRIVLFDESGKSDIRSLLKATYMNSESDPVSWQTLEQEIKGTAYAEEHLAKGNTQLFAKAALQDEEGKQTRLIEIETMPLLIATDIDTEHVRLLGGQYIDLTDNKFDIQSARAIHENIVRVHAWPFESVAKESVLSPKFKSKHCLALLNKCGVLEIAGLKAGIKIRWDDELGVVQEYNKGGMDESCD